MKKSVLGLLIVAFVFCSCEKKSFLKEVEKSIEKEGCFSEQLKKDMEKGEYNLYETNEYGKNYLTSDIPKKGEDLVFLVTLGYDFSYPDDNGVCPMYYDEYSSHVFLQELRDYYSLKPAYEYKEKIRNILLNAKEWLKEDSDGRNAAFKIVENPLNINLFEFNNDKEFDATFIQYLTPGYAKPLNIKDKNGVSLFQHYLNYKMGVIIDEKLFDSDFYSKNKEDYNYFLDLEKNSTYNLSEMSIKYKNYFFYESAPSFNPPRQKYYAGDEEYLDFINQSYLPEIPVYYDGEGGCETYTMVKTQLKTSSSIIEVPPFTKVKVLEEVGDPFIEDNVLVYNLKVECNGKQGEMSGRYISYSKSYADIDNDGEKEILLSNYCKCDDYDYILTAVLINDGKPVLLNIRKDGSYYYDDNDIRSDLRYRKLFFVDNTRCIACQDTTSDIYTKNTSTRLCALYLDQIVELPIGAFLLQDERDQHGVLDFVDISVDKNSLLLRIQLIRDAYNENCYDYYNYHYNLNQGYDSWFKDAFAYYYDLGNVVVIEEESPGYFTIWGEDPQYNYDYGGYGGYDRYYYGGYGW